MSSPTTGTELGKVILTAADVARVVDRIAHQILEKTSGAAETVLLGLGRGSGPRSVAGMRPHDAPWGRPLLGVTREQTRGACAELGVEP